MQQQCGCQPVQRGAWFGTVGPTQNYDFIHPLGKWVLCFYMIAGRLEIFVLLSLFTPSFWRKADEKVFHAPHLLHDSGNEISFLIQCCPMTRLLAIGLIILGAYTLSEIGSSMKLPKVTGYILTGLLLGTFCHKDSFHGCCE